MCVCVCVCIRLLKHGSLDHPLRWTWAWRLVETAPKILPSGSKATSRPHSRTLASHYSVPDHVRHKAFNSSRTLNLQPRREHVLKPCFGGTSVHQPKPRTAANAGARQHREISTARRSKSQKEKIPPRDQSKKTGIKRINPATRGKKTEIKRISDAHKHCTTRGSGTM